MEAFGISRFIPVIVGRFSQIPSVFFLLYIGLKVALTSDGSGNTGDIMLARDDRFQSTSSKINRRYIAELKEVNLLSISGGWANQESASLLLDIFIFNPEPSNHFFWPSLDLKVQHKR